LLAKVINLTDFSWLEKEDKSENKKRVPKQAYLNGIKDREANICICHHPVLKDKNGAKSGILHDMNKINILV